MIFKDYYKILGLETSRVSIDEIKVAYRNAAKKYHPDVNIGDSLAEERIKDINEAYRILSMPNSKRKYDRIWNSQNLVNKKTIWLGIINGILNILWCLVFFTLQQLLLGAIIIIINAFFATALLIELAKIKKWYVNILWIYPIWIFIAPSLNIALWILN